MAPGRRALVWLLPLGGALLAVVALVVIWGGDLMIPLVASQASAALGRPVTIAHLHLVPRACAVTLARERTEAVRVPWD